MAKKERERKFYGELDWLRYQLRELAKELGIEMKDVHLMKKEECQTRIAELNKEKYRKEVETETRANIENLKKELADRNNQITELQKEKVELENAKTDYTKEIVTKDKKIEELKIEIKELEKKNRFAQESNLNKAKTIAANVEKFEELEKEIKEKNAEIRASQITLGKREKEIEEYKNRNIKLVEKIDISLAVIKELKNRKWYQFWK